MSDRRHAASRMAPACFLAIALAASAPGIARAEDWLVLPFANRSAEPALDWLGDGFSISIEEQLRAGGQDTVAYDDARSTLFEWRVPRGRATTLASALKAAERFGAVRVITGHFEVQDGEIQVQARVLDPLEPSVAGELNERAKLGNLLDLHARLGRALWNAAREGMPKFRPADKSPEPPPLAAYEQYVRARIENDPAERLTKLRLAGHSFPTYSLLQYRLAEALRDAGRPQEALRILEGLHATRFLLSADAQALEAALHLERGAAPEAEQAIRRSLDLRESASGRLLRAEILLALERPDEAREEIERSRKLGAPEEECEALARRVAAQAREAAEN
ncbi:MAG: hypothetical protein V3U98_00085 [Acidobacteriota bacterium]